MALLPLTRTFPGLLAATCVIGFGNGIGSGTMMTLGADLAPPAERGEFLGAWNLIGDSGVTLSPVIVGGVADLFVLPAAALVLALFGATAGVIFARLVPEPLKNNRR
jgi:MFS family permease